MTCRHSLTTSSPTFGAYTCLQKSSEKNSICSFAHATKPVLVNLHCFLLCSARLARRLARDNLPEAALFSLNAVIYQSPVFLTTVKHTTASSLTYNEISPSALIALTRFVIRACRAFKKLSRASWALSRRTRRPTRWHVRDLRMSGYERSAASDWIRVARRWSRRAVSVDRAVGLGSAICNSSPPVD